MGDRTARRGWVWALVAAGVLGLLVPIVFVLVWFQPQRLLLDTRVTEARPSGEAVLRRGTFVSRDHPTTGAVQLVQATGGARVLRLDGLKTDNGPDLYVYLSATTASGEEQAFDDDFVSLGRLKGNEGDQNYTVPADADLSRYRSVVIWCDRFNAAFGAADLVT